MAHKITKFDTVLSNEGTEWHRLAKHHPNLVLGDISRIWGEVEAVPALHDGKLVPDTQAILVNGRPIAMVGDRYTPTRTSAVVDAVAEIMSLDERFKLTTIGTVDNQRDAFACIDLAREIEIGRNDRIKPYFTIVDNRTGARKLMTGENATRPVCANTVAVSRRELKDSACRHTSQIEEFISAIVDDFKEKIAEMDEFEASVNRLVETKWDEDTRIAYFNVFAPAPPKAGAKRKTRGHSDAMFNMNSVLAREARETGLPADSAWLGYNAVTNYLQHTKSVRGDRLAARWTGSIANESEKALREALALC